MKNVSLLLFGMIFLFGCQYDFPEPNGVSKAEYDTIKSILFIGDMTMASVEKGAVSSNGVDFTYPSIILNTLQDHDLLVDPYQTNMINQGAANNILMPFGNKGEVLLSYDEPVSYSYNSIINLPRQIFNEVETTDRLTDELIYSSNIIGVAGLRTSKLKDQEIIYPNTRLEVTVSMNRIMEQLSNVNPSYIVVDLCTEDVAYFALNGAIGTVSEDPLFNDATSDLVVEERLTEFITLLRSETDIPIFLVNVPNILTYPYFNSLPYNIELSSMNDREFIDFAQFNSAVREWNYLYNTPQELFRPFIDFDPLANNYNGLLIEDTNLSFAQLENGYQIPKIRQASELDFIFLDNYYQLCKENLGTLMSIPNSKSLTLTEATSVLNLIDKYNSVLGRLSQAYSNCYVLDYHLYMNNLISNNEAGLSEEVADFTILPGGIFSEDGFTLNHRGNALKANFILSEIARRELLSLPQVESRKFTTNEISNDF